MAIIHLSQEVIPISVSKETIMSRYCGVYVNWENNSLDFDNNKYLNLTLFCATINRFKNEGQVQAS